MTPIPPLSELEARLGHVFRDVSLLQAALTHPSYRFEHDEAGADNQRLEFLGDAVLNLLTAERVFHHHAGEDEGMLTVLRSQAASGRALAALAAELGLSAHLRLGRGEELKGGRQRARLLADALEAVLGAAWIDGGHEAAASIFERLFADRLAAASRDRWSGNPKGRLQDIAQRESGALPEYEVVAFSGPGHAPRYRVRVRAGGREAEGEGSSKRQAESRAAEALLASLPGN